MNTMIVVLCVVAAMLLWSYFFDNQLPKPFRARNCQGRGWRTAFPSASKQDIREFLLLFVAAFAFADQEKLKFNPEDQIIKIYRALYPSKWMADALEVETLATDMEARYGFSLEHVWHEKITLGELFRMTQMGHRS